MKALVNVRLGSSRLPGKVLRDIADGETALDVLIKRMKLSQNIDQVIINTSLNALDDQIVEHCRKRGYPCHRGSEDNVLDRMVKAVQAFELDHFVEVFGDCPLIDFRVIDKAVQIYQSGDYDFVGNDLKTTYPPGFEVEIVNGKSLIHSAQLCDDPAISEHGTLYMRLHPDTYKIYNFEYEHKLENIPHLTLDTQEDFELISHIYQLCSQKYGPEFSLKQVLDEFNNDQQLGAINSHIPRKWKQYRAD